MSDEDVDLSALLPEGVEMDSDESIWDFLDFKDLDETPEDFESVDLSALVEMDKGEAEGVDYNRFKHDLQTTFVEREVGEDGLDSPEAEQAYVEFEERIVSNSDGNLFFEEHYKGRTDYDVEEALDAFLEDQANLGSEKDAHRDLLDTQFEQSAEVVGELKSPRESFTIRNFDLDSDE